MDLQIQYDIFESTDEFSLLHREFDALQEQVERVRKGLFARHNKLDSAINELLRLYLLQQDEIAQLKRALKQQKPKEIYDKAIFNRHCSRELDVLSSLSSVA